MGFLDHQDAPAVYPRSALTAASSITTIQHEAARQDLILYPARRQKLLNALGATS
jgi:hypothetical protein